MKTVERLLLPKFLRCQCETESFFVFCLCLATVVQVHDTNIRVLRLGVRQHIHMDHSSHGSFLSQKFGGQSARIPETERESKRDVGIALEP